MLVIIVANCILTVQTVALAPLEKEFVALIDTHQRILHKVANLYCDTREERRDLIQEMILQAWRSYSNYRAEAAFSTWLYRVALNTAISHLKKETCRPDRYTNDTLPTIADFKDTEADEQLNMLYAAIKQLNDMEKALVALYLDEQPYQTIAEILGISANNVGVKMSRVKEKLSLIIKQLPQ